MLSINIRYVFKEAHEKGERCYNDCYEDECDWYAYDQVVHFNDEPKLEIKCHEGTELYQVIKNLVMTLLYIPI